MSEKSSDRPVKLYYRIREVSQITGVKPHVLRYWETEFPVLRPEKGPNDQRRYRASDIELIEQIKRLLYEEKFTIAGARRQLQGRGVRNGQQHEAMPAMPVPVRSPRLDGIAQRLSQVKRELAEIQALLAS